MDVHFGALGTEHRAQRGSRWKDGYPPEAQSVGNDEGSKGQTGDWDKGRRKVGAHGSALARVRL